MEKSIPRMPSTLGYQVPLEYVIYVGRPKSNRTLNLAHELEVVA